MPRSFLSLIVWLQILILTGSLSDQSCRNSIWETTSQSHACLCLHKRLFALVLISPTPSHVCKSVSLSQRFNQRAIFFLFPFREKLAGTFCWVVLWEWIESNTKICFSGVVPYTDFLTGSGVEVDPGKAVVVDKVTLGPASTLVLQKQICVRSASLKSRQEALQGCLSKLRF